MQKRPAGPADEMARAAAGRFMRLSQEQGIAVANDETARTAAGRFMSACVPVQRPRSRT